MHNSFEPNNRHNFDVSTNFVDEEQSNLISRIVDARKTKKSLQEITGCKKPAFNVGKKKRAYQECLANYQAQITAQGDAVAQAELKVAQAKEEAEFLKSKIDTLTKDSTGGTKSASTDSTGVGSGDGKILGMSKGLAIGLGIAVLVIGGFITYRVIKARKAKV